MSMAPVLLLVVATSTIAFQAIVFGEDLIQKSIITTLEFGDCASGDGPFETMACYVGNFFKGIVNVFLVIGSVVLFLFNALTFNIPGAPTSVRFVFGSIFIGGIGWSVANLFRGSSV